MKEAREVLGGEDLTMDLEEEGTIVLIVGVEIIVLTEEEVEVIETTEVVEDSDVVGEDLPWKVADVEMEENRSQEEGDNFRLKIKLFFGCILGLHLNNSELLDHYPELERINDILL